MFTAINHILCPFPQRNYTLLRNSKFCSKSLNTFILNLERNGKTKIPKTISNVSHYDSPPEEDSRILTSPDTLAHSLVPAYACGSTTP